MFFAVAVPYLLVFSREFRWLDPTGQRLLLSILLLMILVGMFSFTRFIFGRKCLTVKTGFITRKTIPYTRIRKIEHIRVRVKHIWPLSVGGLPSYELTIHYYTIHPTGVTPRRLIVPCHRSEPDIRSSFERFCPHVKIIDRTGK